MFYLFMLLFGTATTIYAIKNGVYKHATFGETLILGFITFVVPIVFWLIIFWLKYGL